MMARFYIPAIIAGFRGKPGPESKMATLRLEGNMNKRSNDIGTYFRRSIPLVLLLLVTLSLLGTSVPAFAADDTITIGVVLPTTGSESKPGQYQKEGIELAIKQINDAGGIMIKSKGKKFKINEIFYDDGTDSKKS